MCAHIQPLKIILKWLQISNLPRKAEEIPLKTENPSAVTGFQSVQYWVMYCTCIGVWTCVCECLCWRLLHFIFLLSLSFLLGCLPAELNTEQSAAVNEKWGQVSRGARCSNWEPFFKIWSNFRNSRASCFQRSPHSLFQSVTGRDAQALRLIE